MTDNTQRIGGVETFSLADLIPTVYNLHRKAVRPKWRGRHGSVVKGSVKWTLDGYQVVYSFLLGYETTLRETETYALWFMAMNAYREHDRTVRERQRLEDFRSGERLA